MTDAASPLEVMAAVLSREIRDGELLVSGGVRSAVPTAAAFLAQRTHAPNATLLLGMGVVNPRPDRLWPAAGDERYAEGCEGFIDLNEIFDLTESGRIDVAFYGGLQIDRRGNTNLTWVGVGAERIRGPGVANAALALTAGRVLLYSERHVPRVFVDRVDVVTIAGHRADGSRPEYAGGGPDICVTPLGVFDFPEPSRSFALRSLNREASWEDVCEATGFEVERPAELRSTDDPSFDELALLREIDPDGLLRREHGLLREEA